MKKLVCILLPLLLIGNVAFAADNQSAAYLRSLSREAVTDSVDATYFNPAGTAFLDKGLHLQVMNQSIFSTYSHTSATTNEYEADTPVWLFPTARMVYNSGSWAGFFDFSIPAGGGRLVYEDGAYLLDTGGLAGSFTGSSSVFAFSLGGSYRIGDMISIGASGRFLYGNDGKELTIDTVGPTQGSAEAKATGIGFGGMFGVDIIPFDGFTFAVTVETVSKLEMEYTEVTGDAGTVLALGGFGISEGGTYDADLPWRIRTGISYEMPFGLTVRSSFKYDFYEALDDSLRNSWTVSTALAYDITNRLEISVGGSYDIDEVPDVDNYDGLNPELSSFTVAGGVGVEVSEGLLVDVGVLNVFYQEDTAAATSGFTDIDKKVLIAGIGVTYSF